MNVQQSRADTDPLCGTLEHSSTHMHLVVRHCGLGIGLAAGKCCAERISEQGGDVGLERKGDGVAVKSVASASKISNEALSAQDKKSQKKHHPLFSSQQVTRSLQNHIAASLKLCERLVELQRGEQLPRACFADAVRNKAAHTQLSAK
jgi:hypothetical protein